MVPLGCVIGGLTVPGRAGRAESQAIAAFLVAAGTAVGLERAVALALGALGLALVVRAVGPGSVLLGGTVVVGGAIAISNVLLPVIVKRDFPAAAGRVTGIYTTAMGIAAAAAAALTIPIGDALGLGWRGGIAVWAVLVVVALIGWLTRTGAQASPEWAGRPVARRTMLGDPLAWQVTLYLGLQSLGFYTVVAWLSSIYRDLGMDPAEAGFVSAMVPLGSVIGGLTVPGRAGRAESQAIAAFLVAAGTAVGLIGVVVAPLAAPFVWALIIGTCQGAGFPLALTLIVLRTRVPQQTQQLSAMAQTVGYLVASTGPVLVGAIHDAFGGWTVALLLLAAIAVIQGLMGLGAGRPMYVGERGGAQG
jgi:CP family cyanate transporter-like MFS transporter